jgi:hypothetical protein
MPRTIRKRQLRNKKSRKQRGGELTEQQDKIKKIGIEIDKNIQALIALLGEHESQNSNKIDILDEKALLTEKLKPKSDSEQ